MVKKIILGLMILAFSGVTVVGTARPVEAADNCKNAFLEALHIRSWNEGLVDDKCQLKDVKQDSFSDSSEGSVRGFIWIVAFNITSMILSVIGYLAIAFVIYGGYQYMLSRGDPRMVMGGKKTITNAITGLVICMIASLITDLVSDVIAGARGGDFVKVLANKAFFWAGIIAVLMIVIGGFMYIASTGDAGRLRKAKDIIVYAVIGLVIVILAGLIVNFVVDTVTEGTAYIDRETIRMIVG